MYICVLVGVAAICVLLVSICVPLILISSKTYVLPVPNLNVTFDIEITYAASYTTAIIDIFEAAADTWGSVITTTFTQGVEINGNWCGVNFAQQRTIDKLLIHVSLLNIDGLGGVLGSAGPCAVDNNGFPRFGVINIDTADVNAMLNAGTLFSVVKHEIGHVLGIGTLWENGVTFTVQENGYPYLGTAGNREDALLGRTGGAIVENLGGVGTAGSHWKESVYDSELMTGFVEVSGNMPLSRLSIAALEDLGYTVNYGAAEPYSIQFLRLRGSIQKNTPVFAKERIIRPNKRRLSILA